MELTEIEYNAMIRLIEMFRKTLESIHANAEMKDVLIASHEKRIAELTRQLSDCLDDLCFVRSGENVLTGCPKDIYDVVWGECLNCEREREKYFDCYLRYYEGIDHAPPRKV